MLLFYRVNGSSSVVLKNSRLGTWQEGGLGGLTEFRYVIHESNTPRKLAKVGSERCSSSEHLEVLSLRDHIRAIDPRAIVELASETSLVTFRGRLHSCREIQTPDTGLDTFPYLPGLRSVTVGIGMGKIRLTPAWACSSPRQALLGSAPDNAWRCLLRFSVLCCAGLCLVVFG